MAFLDYPRKIAFEETLDSVNRLSVTEIQGDETLSSSITSLSPFSGLSHLHILCALGQVKIARDNCPAEETTLQCPNGRLPLHYFIEFGLPRFKKRRKDLQGRQVASPPSLNDSSQSQQHLRQPSPLCSPCIDIIEQPTLDQKQETLSSLMGSQGEVSEGEEGDREEEEEEGQRKWKKKERKEEEDEEKDGDTESEGGKSEIGKGKTKSKVIVRKRFNSMSKERVSHVDLLNMGGSPLLARKKIIQKVGKSKSRPEIKVQELIEDQGSDGDGGGGGGGGGSGGTSPAGSVGEYESVKGREEETEMGIEIENFYQFLIEGVDPFFRIPQDIHRKRQFSLIHFAIYYQQFSLLKLLRSFKAKWEEPLSLSSSSSFCEGEGEGDERAKREGEKTGLELCVQVVENNGVGVKILDFLLEQTSPDLLIQMKDSILGEVARTLCSFSLDPIFFESDDLPKNSPLLLYAAELSYLVEMAVKVDTPISFLETLVLTRHYFCSTLELLEKIKGYLGTYFEGVCRLLCVWGSLIPIDFTTEPISSQLEELLSLIKESPHYVSVPAFFSSQISLHHDSPLQQFRSTPKRATPPIQNPFSKFSNVQRVSLHSPLMGKSPPVASPVAGERETTSVGSPSTGPFSSPRGFTLHQLSSSPAVTPIQQKSLMFTPPSSPLLLGNPKVRPRQRYRVADFAFCPECVLLIQNCLDKEKPEEDSGEFPSSPGSTKWVGLLTEDNEENEESEENEDDSSAVSFLLLTNQQKDKRALRQKNTSCPSLQKKSSINTISVTDYIEYNSNVDATSKVQHGSSKEEKSRRSRSGIRSRSASGLNQSIGRNRAGSSDHGSDFFTADVESEADPYLGRLGQDLLQPIYSKLLASHLLLKSSQLQKMINPVELACYPLSEQEKEKTNYQSGDETLKEYASFLNDICHWTSVLILFQRDPEERIKMIEFFIGVCSDLLKLGNFHSCLGVLTGLRCSAVSRLKSWPQSQETKEAFERTSKLFSHSKNFSKYRETIDSYSAPCVVYLGVMQRDLVYIHDSNSTFLGSERRMINFSKMCEIKKCLEKWHFSKLGVALSSNSSPLFHTYLSGIKNSYQQISEDLLYQVSLKLEPTSYSLNLVNSPETKLPEAAEAKLRDIIWNYDLSAFSNKKQSSKRRNPTEFAKIISSKYKNKHDDPAEVRRNKSVDLFDLPEDSTPQRKNRLKEHVDSTVLSVESKGRLFAAILGGSDLGHASYYFTIEFERREYITTNKVGPITEWNEEFCFLVTDTRSPITLKFFKFVKKKRKKEKKKEKKTDLLVTTYSICVDDLEEGVIKREVLEFYWHNDKSDMECRGLLYFHFSFEGDHAFARYFPLEKLLMEDDKFYILEGLCNSVTLDDVSWLTPPILSILVWNEKVIPFLKRALRKEVFGSQSKDLLFRGQNLIIKILSLFAFQVGQSYLVRILQPLLLQIEADEAEDGSFFSGFELDPQKMEDSDTLDKNLPYLLKWTSKLLESIFASIDFIPVPLFHVSAYLRRYVLQAFSDGIHHVLSGFFFLRFLCPILTTPETLPGLRTQSPSAKMRRLLVLIAKIIQNVASLVEFGDKEQYMMCCNPFIREMVPQMTEFYETISAKKNLKLSLKINRDPVQRHFYHLLHVAIVKYNVVDIIKKVGVREELEIELSKLGRPKQDQKPVEMLGYVDLEKIVEDLKNPETGISSFALHSEEMLKKQKKRKDTPALRFSSFDLIDWFCVNVPICHTRSEAVILGNRLMEFQFISSCSPSTLFFTDSEDMFELSETSDLATSGRVVLNMKEKVKREDRERSGMKVRIDDGEDLDVEIFGGGAVQYSCDLLETIGSLFCQVSSLVENEIRPGMLGNIRDNPKFKIFTLSTCKLQAFDLKEVTDENEKAAFWLNIYHTLVLHAHAERGAPTSSRQLAKLLNSSSYNIGGFLFSLNEIEHAILRAPLPTPKSVASLPGGRVVRFGKKDARRPFALTYSFQLISFAINCGAKSCPLIMAYSGNTVQKSLRKAASKYLSDTMTVRKEKGSLIVQVPKILVWYLRDFGENKKASLRNLIPFMDPLCSNLMSELGKVLRDGKKSTSLKLEPFPFEWEFACNLSLLVGSEN